MSSHKLYFRNTKILCGKESHSQVGLHRIVALCGRKQMTCTLTNLPNYYIYTWPEKDAHSILTWVKQVIDMIGQAMVICTLTIIQVQQDPKHCLFSQERSTCNCFIIFFRFILCCYNVHTSNHQIYCFRLSVRVLVMQGHGIADTIEHNTAQVNTREHNTRYDN